MLRTPSLPLESTLTGDRDRRSLWIAEKKARRARLEAEQGARQPIGDEPGESRAHNSEI
jgi:hypothetical protein